MHGWNIVLKGRIIDTIYFLKNLDEEHVRKALLPGELPDNAKLERCPNA